MVEAMTMSPDEQKAQELSEFLAQLPDHRLLAVAGNALLIKYRVDGPMEAILQLIMMASTLADAVADDDDKLKLIEQLRNIADEIEKPLLQARIERSWN
jgi:hypothetical protein